MLAATALCLAALAQAGPGKPGEIHGRVVEKGTGRPLVGVSVHLFNEQATPTATTDERGRFDHLGVKEIPAVPVHGQLGPLVRVRAGDDRTWPWTIVETDDPAHSPPERAKTQAIEALYQQAETHWEGNGPGASLVVQCPPVGAVEAVVRGPDGKPLADRPIVVGPTPEYPGAVIIQFSGKTSPSGAFQLQSFEGSREFVVQVPGLGFGSTGRIEVVRDKVERPELPPLTRFARIEGRLAPGLIAPGTKVSLRTEVFHRAVGPAITPDEQGRFTLADVVPGDYRITVRKEGQEIPTAYREFRAEPGRVLGNVVLEPAPQPSPEARASNQRLLRQLNGDQNKTITWVEGTIRDEQGRPFPDASVYLRFEYHGGIRMYEQVKKTKSDARGAYRFEGPLYSSMGMLTVMASSKGRPPAIAYALGPDASLEDEERKPVRLDIALGSSGASANVTVVRDGRRLPDVAVRLSATGAVSLVDPSYVLRARGMERSEVEALVAPTTKTGPDGVARFENLLPGTFELVAADSADPSKLLQVRWPRDPDLAFGIAEGSPPSRGRPPRRPSRSTISPIPSASACSSPMARRSSTNPSPSASAGAGRHRQHRSRSMIRGWGATISRALDSGPSSFGSAIRS